jgi:hypothetical protein
MSETNITNTDQAAATVQAPTAEGWADDLAQGRCTATHVDANVTGDTTVRCDAQAGHAGAEHQSRDSGREVRWSGSDQDAHGGGAHGSGSNQDAHGDED